MRILNLYPFEVINGFKTSLRKVLGASDFSRWGTAVNLSPSWDTRTKQIATLIDPGSSVLEFGAGRKVLLAYLEEGCIYTASDLVDREGGTLIADLNATQLPDFPKNDVAVFSGVLEYVNDVPRLVSNLHSTVDQIIASYAVREQNLKNRRSKGWVNDFTFNEFIVVFNEYGFSCEHFETWGSQFIFKFVKNSS